jgi:hypothetical protein
MGCDEGWQVGYWAESVAAALIEPLLDYVTHQRAHHANDSTLEPWQQIVQEPASSGLDVPLS